MTCSSRSSERRFSRLTSCVRSSFAADNTFLSTSVPAHCDWISCNSNLHSGTKGSKRFFLVLRESIRNAARPLCWNSLQVLELGVTLSSDFEVQPILLIDQTAQPLSPVGFKASPVSIKSATKRAPHQLRCAAKAPPTPHPLLSPRISCRTPPTPAAEWRLGA